MSLFVGRLPTHNFDDRDLEDIFYKYGRIINCQVKKGSRFAFGFIEFEDPEDAYDAIRATDGLDIDGTRIVVEKAKGTPREKRHNETGCFNCGEEGHFARDCRRGRRDYRRDDRYRSRSRTPERYGAPRDYYASRRRSYSRSRSPYDDRRGRSYSRSRSPVPHHHHARRYSRSPSPRDSRDMRPRSPLMQQQPPPPPMYDQQEDHDYGRSSTNNVENNI